LSSFFKAPRISRPAAVVHEVAAEAVVRAAVVVAVPGPAAAACRGHRAVVGEALHGHPVAAVHALPAGAHPDLRVAAVRDLPAEQARVPQAERARAHRNFHPAALSGQAVAAFHPHPRHDPQGVTGFQAVAAPPSCRPAAVRVREIVRRNHLPALTRVRAVEPRIVLRNYLPRDPAEVSRIDSVVAA